MSIGDKLWRLNPYNALRGIVDSIRHELQLQREAIGFLRAALGRIESRQCAENDSNVLVDHEFKVWSQWGEDGIIQFLLRRVAISRPVFVEFGVESYVEANTRFLLIDKNWSGLVIDGSEGNVQAIRSDPIYWRYNLKAVQAFITRENINSLLRDNGLTGEIGLLSIDIDGNDYWVWEAIDVVNPAIVIVEYNSLFGPTRAATVPYDAKFERAKAHPSCVYYGASLAALVSLGEQKGFAFVGSNRAGNNAFFVRMDLLPPNLRALTAVEGFVARQFRESRDERGQLNFASTEEETVLVNSLPLVEIK